MHGSMPQPRLERHNTPLEKSNTSSEISDAMQMLHEVAEPRPVGDTIKAAIGRASHKLGWKYERTREVWYGNARRLHVNEMDALRERARARLAVSLDAERRRNIEQIAVLRTRLQLRDGEFHRDDIAALEWILREISGT